MANGEDPVTVEVAAFSVKSSQQSKPVSGSTNTITVTLLANFALADGSTLTFDGSDVLADETVDAANLAVTSTSNLLGARGACPGLFFDFRFTFLRD